MFLSIVAIVRTDSTGYLPFADSPDEAAHENGNWLYAIRHGIVP